MKKRLITIFSLLAIIGIVVYSNGGLKMTPFTTAFAVGDLTVNWGVPEGDPIFTISNMAPGGVEERDVVVQNDAVTVKGVGVKGIPTNNADNLASVMTIIIKKNGSPIYGPKNLNQFFTESSSINGIFLSNQNPSESVTYNFEVTFDSSAGNEWQNKTLVFDLKIGVIIDDVPAECSGGQFSNSIFGTESNNHLVGTGGNDLIVGFGGNDNIEGMGGDDCIIGGEGNDKIRGGTGNDLMFGGNGVDKIDGGSDNDVAFGGDNDDKIDGGSGNDNLKGESGNDKIDGGSENDVIDGGIGNDQIDGGSGNDTINGADGNDKIDGDSGNDVINGGEGNDNIDGGSGDDLIHGNNGNDDIKGGAGVDNLIGDVGNDKANGNSGVDTCNAESEFACEF